MSASERLNELMRITASYDIVSFDVFPVFSNDLVVNLI